MSSLQISNQSIDSFNLNPNFIIDSILLDGQYVSNVPQVHQDKWDKCMDKTTFGGEYLICPRVGNMKYIYAKKRYGGLTILLEMCEEPWPLLRLAMAEALFLLCDLYSCQELLVSLAQEFPNDTKLSEIIDILSQCLAQDEALDEEYHEQNSSEDVFRFSTPTECPSRECASEDQQLSNVREKWALMKENEENALLLFKRYACIESNMLEDVFSLEGQSWPRLVRRGFYVNAIDGISKTSKQQKKPVIIRILQNTINSLELISYCLDDFSLFTPEFIKTIHRTMLLHDNFVEDSFEADDEIHPIYQVIPCGKYRRVACIVDHNEGKDVTQFCKHCDIEGEMHRYCSLAQHLLGADTVEIFTKVAWLQWAFLRIHPFADGNGRVARILSSIPLYKNHLPPVVVTQANKVEYFQVLHCADRNNSLEELSSFLHDSMLSAMNDLAHLPPNDSSNTSVRSGQTKTRKGEIILSSSSSDEDESSAGM